MGLVLTAKTAGATANGMTINVVSGTTAGSTYDATANNGKGVLTLTLLANQSYTQAQINTLLTAGGGQLVNQNGSVFANDYSVSFSANSAASITTANTAVNQTSTAVTASTSGGSGDAASVSTVDANGKHANFTLIANTPGSGPSSVTLSVAYAAAATSVSYNNGTLSVSLASTAQGASTFTGTAAQLAAIQQAFAQTAIGSSFTLGTSIDSGFVGKAATGAVTQALDNTATQAATPAITVKDAAAGNNATFVVTANNVRCRR